MNKILKKLLVFLNLTILIFSFLWLKTNDPSYEPIIVIFGQFGALILLIIENKIPTTEIKRIDKSTVKTSKDVNTKIEDVKQSYIETK